MDLDTCWCGRPPHYIGIHMTDTADPRWPFGEAACLCGGGTRKAPHHADACAEDRRKGRTI